jgi:SAM-dependent methyltransferase
MKSAYHETRLAHAPRRDVLWQALWRHYFSRLIEPDDCVLDIGCGHGAFINAVVARKRIGLDAWPDFPVYLEPGVEAIVGAATEVGQLVKGPVDFAFASNLFEHLSQAELVRLLDGLRRILSPRGTLNIIQPNFRYAYREYFDDYTHVAVYTDVGLCDLLRANGFDIIDMKPRFLPLSIKSRLPVSESPFASISPRRSSRWESRC